MTVGAQWLADLETAVLDTPPGQVGTPPAWPDAGFDFEQSTGVAVVPQLMPMDGWQMQWNAIHAAADAAVWIKTGQSPGLSDLATSDTGTAAAQATYDLIARYPALAAILLDPAGSAWAGGIAILAHVMVCTNAVKSTVKAAAAEELAQRPRKNAPETAEPPEGDPEPEETETAANG